MNIKKLTFNNSYCKNTIRLSILLILLCSNVFSQTPCNIPAPSGEVSQYFCSQNSWLNSGFTNVGGDTLDELDVCGSDLTWYDDNNGSPGNIIANPASEIIQDGQTYYVTQTIAGCESDPLVITVTDRECACFKEDENETFYNQPIDEHRTCAQAVGATLPFPLGTTPNTMDYEAVMVTPGFDPQIPALSRTNPNSCSNSAYRLNDTRTGLSTNSNVVTMRKEFVAGEVFVFSFATVLENPGHPYDQQPFFQVRLYDQNNNLIQSRCLVSVENDCIFNSLNSGNLLYSDWSCLKLNTRSILGEPARVEFSVADCTQGAHHGYAYIDEDMYVGDDSPNVCDDSSFGFVTVDSIAPDSIDSCYIPQMQDAQGLCSSGVASSTPLPIEVCGVFDDPNSTGDPASYDPNTDFVLNIIQNGNVVGTVSSPTIDNANGTFCFTVTESDFLVSPYGNFDLSAEIDFRLDCGSEYGFLVDDRSSLEICPTAGCPNPIVACDDNGNGLTSFDLSDSESEIIDTWDPNDLTLTYYENELSAHMENAADQITGADIQNYNNNTPYDQIVYVRVDWDSSQFNSCYYLVELPLTVEILPDLSLPNNITVCGTSMNEPIMATPNNLQDLGAVSYEWYRNGNRLPFSGSIYYATSPGEYSVTVINNGCEYIQTTNIELIDFDVDLGEDPKYICGDGSADITANVDGSNSTSNFDSSNLEYLWSTGETSQTINVTQSGTYSVEVTYNGTCLEQASVDVEVANLPEITPLADVVKCRDEQVEVIVDVVNIDEANLEYMWYVDGSVIPGESTAMISVTEEGTYTVEINEIGSDFCFASEDFEVSFYANADCVITQGLSPDSTPGENDCLDLEFLSNRTGIANIKLYSRYGRLVFEENDYVNSFCGQDQDGDLLPTGTYYYVLELNAEDPIFGRSKKGWVYINRDAN